jgi:hypothetical protein
MSFQISELSKWFVPPVVVPIGLALIIAAYALYRSYP